jgi:1-acyl-sn-glycerol-3-phosphate acyltransferase
MRLLQIFSMVIFFFFLQIGLVLLAIISFPLGLFPAWGRKFYYGLLSFFLRLLLFLNFIRVTVSGKENIPRQKSLIFVGNHPGLLEPMYFIAHLPVRVLLVADKGILRIPLLGRVLKTAGCLTYKPEGEDAGFMVDLLSALREGESVLIFPPALRREREGKGSLDRALFRTAHACQATVIPFVIKQPGADQLRRGIFVTPGKTSIMVGKPITPAELDQSGASGIFEKRFRELTGG